MPIDPNIEAMDADSMDLAYKWTSGFLYGNVDNIVAKLAEVWPHPDDPAGYRIPMTTMQLWGPFYPKKQTGVMQEVLEDGTVLDIPVFARRRNLVLMLRKDALFTFSVHGNEGHRVLKWLNEENWCDVHMNVNMETLGLRFPEHIVGNAVAHIAEPSRRR